MMRALLTLAAAAAAGPVPAHTTATSVSFTSPQTAFVLGTAPCAHPPCTAVLETVDRGASWVGLPAPREAVSRVEGNGLWGLRFADPLRGFAYGRGLWATSDGARRWSRIRAPARFVFTLSVVAHRRLVAIASGCGQNCGPSAGLYGRSLKSGPWRRLAATKPGYGGSIAVHGRTVWALVGTRLFVSTDGGASFHAHRSPCRGGTFGDQVSDDGPHTYMLCNGSGFAGGNAKYLYRTSGPRSGWTLVGRPPREGGGVGLAAGSDHAIVVASYSAASWLYASADGGHRWRTPVFERDGGAGWADLGFTTATDGVVIHGPAATDGGSANFPGQLVLTEDGGRTWHRAAF